MKEETKKKLCKISKIVGFVITFGFAVFGALCAAMLIGNGSKKDDIKTLDSSLVQNEVRLERNIKPRKALDNFNYLEDPIFSFSTIFMHRNVCTFNKDYTTYFYNEDSLPKGYYRLSVAPGGVNYDTSLAFVSQQGRIAIEEAYNDSVEHTWVQGDIPAWVYYSASRDASTSYIYVDYEGYDYLTFSGIDINRVRFELVNTLEIPVSSSISFPDSFSPLGLFGDSVTNNGGYVYLPKAEGNELDIEITGLIFKYGGVVYDGIHIECVRALSMGYINDDGQLVKQGGANDYMWALSWIKFYQRYKGQSPQDGIVVVMAELKSVTDNANDMPVAFTGRTQWVNRSDRTIQIIDDLGTTTGRYDGRYSDMTDKKLMEWVSSSFSVGNSLGIMGNNSVFDIFTNAFDSVLPILSIAILPNITLGMLLFIPLIGAIIVIIIRVVKK